MSPRFDPRELLVKLIKASTGFDVKFVPTPTGGSLVSIHSDPNEQIKEQRELDLIIEEVLK